MKKTILAMLAGAAALTAFPALADNGQHRGWNKHGGHKHHWKQPRHYGHAHAPRRVVVVPAPVYRYAPPRVVYAPPPVVVHPAPVYYPAPVYRHAEPSVSFRINLPL